MKLSAIILARTNSDAAFRMTSDCILTLSKSEAERPEIVVIESNKQYAESGFSYPDFVKVIVPEADFNFHKFLNIGIRASIGDFVALCNNDLVFHKNWFAELMKVKTAHPEIKSFSPAIHFTDEAKSGFSKGYKIRTHVAGWCIVAERGIFEQIGYLDEIFDFNYADNDYAMTLKKYNVPHAVVFSSHVDHLEREKTKQARENVYESLATSDEPWQLIPKYIQSEPYKWLLNDKKSLADHLKFHKKWGSPKLLYRKNRIADFLIRHNLGALNRFVLSL